MTSSRADGVTVLAVRVFRAWRMAGLARRTCVLGVRHGLWLPLMGLAKCWIGTRLLCAGQRVRCDMWHSDVWKQDDTMIVVTTEGSQLRGLSQAAGRLARKWARENGVEVVERVSVSTSATYGFAAQVKAWYRIQ